MRLVSRRRWTAVAHSEQGIWIEDRGLDRREIRDWLRDAMTGDLDGPRPVGDASKPQGLNVSTI